MPNVSRADRRQLERDNAKLPHNLKVVPTDDWPLQLRSMLNPPDMVWRSRHFLVQGFSVSVHPAVLCRLSVNRTTMVGEGWAENVSWDELQEIKAQCGYGLYDAVEALPRHSDIVNVANMRHIWVLREPVPFFWRRGG